MGNLFKKERTRGRAVRRLKKCHGPSAQRGTTTAETSPSWKTPWTKTQENVGAKKTEEEG